MGDAVTIDRQLNVLCSLCDQCEEPFPQPADVTLFDQCLKIMQDDLVASFEYLRLKSSILGVICNIRGLINHIITGKKQLRWYDGQQKDFIEIPPSAFCSYLGNALIRWGYSSIPSLSPLVEALQASDAVNDQPLETSCTENQGVPESSETLDQRTLITSCPECGERMRMVLREGDLEQLADGGILKKAIEHGEEEEKHLVELFIDSQFSIRRIRGIEVEKAG